MNHIVTLENGGNTYYLKGTVWAYSRDRAQVFASHDEATAALAKAKKFMAAGMFKKAVITPAETE